MITTAEEDDNFSVSDSVMSKQRVKVKRIAAHDNPKFWSVPVSKLLATAEKELDDVNKKLATYNELKRRQQAIEANVNQLRMFMKEAKPKPMSSIPEGNGKKRKIAVQSDEEDLASSDEEKGSDDEEE
jgi:hypothetical protein